MITGGQIKNFNEGWALVPFRGSKAHHWRFVRDATDDEMRESAKVYVSKCGLVGLTIERVPALEPGGFLLCKKCAARVA